MQFNVFNFSASGSWYPLKMQNQQQYLSVSLGPQPSPSYSSSLLLRSVLVPGFLSGPIWVPTAPCSQQRSWPWCVFLPCLRTIWLTHPSRSTSWWYVPCTSTTACQIHWSIACNCNVSSAALSEFKSREFLTPSYYHWPPKSYPAVPRHEGLRPCHVVGRLLPWFLWLPSTRLSTCPSETLRLTHGLTPPASSFTLNALKLTTSVQVVIFMWARATHLSARLWH